MFSRSSQKHIDAVKFWAAGRLNQLSTLHQSIDDVDALLHIANDEELVLACMEIVGQSDEAMEFIESLMKKRAQLMEGVAIGLTHSQDGMVAYQKTALGAPGKKSVKQPKQEKNETQQQQQQKQNQKQKKKEALVREECYCMGSHHPVLGNCLSCGKIICELEGDGLPCMFCGVVFLALSKKSNDAAAFKDAVARKDALLEYERKSVARSLIYDDQGDYFNSDSQWMSQDEKTRLRSKEKDLREQKMKQKRGVKITLDIFGRRMIVCEDEDASKSIYQPFNLEDILPKKEEQIQQLQEQKKLGASGTTLLRPSYIEDKKEQPRAAKPSVSSKKPVSGRVQDAYFEVEEGQVEEKSAAFFQFFGVCFDRCQPMMSLDNKDLEGVSFVLELEHISNNSSSNNSIVRARYPLSASERDKLQEIVKSDVVRGVLLDFSALGVSEDCRFNTLAKHHAHLTAETVAWKSDKGKVEIWVLPFHNQLRADGEYVTYRKYWNELNETVRKNVTFVVTASTEHNPIVSKEHVRMVRAIFGEKRPLVLFDSVSVLFTTYAGRHFGLDLKGLFVVTSGLYPKSETVSVRSALAFQRHPATYDAAESFKQIVAACLGEEHVRDCKEVKHFLEVSLFVPSLVRDKAAIDAMRRQLLSRRRLEEILESCCFLRSSEKVKNWLGTELEILEKNVLKPVEELCEASRATALNISCSPAKTVSQKKAQKQNAKPKK
jgi:hypothetical protein